MSRESMRPLALFLANSCNLDDEGRGEVVACLLSIARVMERYEQLDQRVWTDSDLALGRFEVDRSSLFRWVRRCGSSRRPCLPGSNTSISTV